MARFAPESNYRPKASFDDDGLWRRLRELPFPVSRPRREDRDESVKAALVDPAQSGAAIIAWAAAGAARWLAEGLTEPAVVMAATDSYRRSQEPLADFVADCCRLGPGLSVPAARLREEYEGWCKAHGVRHPIAGKAWGKALRTLECAKKPTMAGIVWHGIDVRMTPIDAPEPGDEPPDWVSE